MKKDSVQKGKVVWVWPARNANILPSQYSKFRVMTVDCLLANRESTKKHNTYQVYTGHQDLQT